MDKAASCNSGCGREKKVLILINKIQNILHEFLFAKYIILKIFKSL